MMLPRLVGLIALAASCAAALSNEADPAVPIYHAEGEPVGVLTCAGSSTVARMLKPIAAAFQARHPGVTVALVGAGSASGPPALRTGSADLAMMSRPFTTDELRAVAAAKGREPEAITVALDALAVYVPRDNPLTGISLVQLDGLLSAERRRGSPPLTRWGQLGLDGEWADRVIVPFGFRITAGGFAMIQELVLQGADYAPQVSREFVGSSIVQGVVSEPGGIGISSVFLHTPTTRVVPVGLDGAPYRYPTRARCLAGEYPLTRRLQIWVLRGDDGHIAEPARSFLRWCCSAEAQQQLAAAGEYTLDQALAERELASISR